jgi:hypothetical protein
VRPLAAAADDSEGEEVGKEQEGSAEQGAAGAEPPLSAASKNPASGEQTPASLAQEVAAQGTCGPVQLWPVGLIQRMPQGCGGCIAHVLL